MQFTASANTKPPSVGGGAIPLARAWYGASIPEFRETSDREILGTLTRASEFSVTPSQTDAWLEQITLLKQMTAAFDGQIYLEFAIPRMGRRIDALIVTGPVVVVIEFKVFASHFDRPGRDQVWDYALDLKNFHKGSHDALILPILVATNAVESRFSELLLDQDGVYKPLLLIPGDVPPIINRVVAKSSATPIDQTTWIQAPYSPTPSIIEAARALYAQHSVEAIARFDAGAENLAITSKSVEVIIDEARLNKRKVICFVTGVPGAGKTLVGLNVATRRGAPNEPTHAVFLSGNGPLVAVLREALTRDEFARLKEQGQRVRKGEIAGRVKAFIQNIHHFRDEGLRDLERCPADRVVIFDEAQRAWNHAKASDFMRRKRNRPEFSQSEPEFLISYMDRHTDWAVVVCLVGGGQEIHTGEAGIATWLDALRNSFPQWDMFISDRLTDSEYAAGHALDSLRGRSCVTFDPHLHLAVSMRSFRAENVSHFVKALLDQDRDAARYALADLKKSYPMAITRDLDRAKDWIRDHARGNERYGLVASSKALRLKPHAIDIRVDVDPIHWFLNDRSDVRSSYYLEDAATEFQVQGLELEWVCVTWDGDLRCSESGWQHHDFRGSRWQRVHKSENQSYLLNAYRVLLTRARQGMVIFVPPGDANDPTRLPSYYDGTFSYLKELGILALD